MRSLTNYPVGGSGGNVILRNQSLNFTNLTAVIYDSRVTESTLILVYYSEATEAAAQSAGITSETNNGNITFTAANTPSTTIVCDIVLLSEGSGGGGGTSNYNDLTNKPSINGVELSGNKTASQLGMANSNTFQGTIAEWNQLTTAEKKAYDHASIPDSIDGGVTFPANKVIMTGGGNVEERISANSFTTPVSIPATTNFTATSDGYVIGRCVAGASKQLTIVVNSEQAARAISTTDFPAITNVFVRKGMIVSWTATDQTNSSANFIAIS